MAGCGGCDLYGTHDHPHARYALTTNTEEPEMGWIADRFRRSTSTTPPPHYEPMQVRRVRTPTGERIDPAYNEAWPEITRLRWQAAVISLDTESRVEVQYQPHACWDDLYEVHVPAFGPQRVIDYDAATRMLNVYRQGCSAGREVERRIAANSLQSLTGTFGAAPPAATDEPTP